MIVIPLEQLEPDPEELHRAKKSLRRRRLIALGLALAAICGIYYLITSTDVLGPVTAALGPVGAFISEAADDPQKALITVTAAIIPMLGIMYYIFENEG